MVKNFFYSSIRKNMRKIVKGRISLDQQTNPDARRVSLYFIEYVKLNNQAYEDHKQGRVSRTMSVLKKSGGEKYIIKKI